MQTYIFGRTLNGEKDALLGYKKIDGAVYGRYPLITKTEDQGDEVKGFAYEVSINDLKKADIYETSAYTRKKITLKSGKQAWVYVENSK